LVLRWVRPWVMLKAQQLGSRLVLRLGQHWVRRLVLRWVHQWATPTVSRLGPLLVHRLVLRKVLLLGWHSERLLVTQLVTTSASHWGLRSANQLGSRLVYQSGSQRARPLAKQWGWQ